jgi:hypothetical protein
VSAKALQITLIKACDIFGERLTNKNFIQEEIKEENELG